MFPTLHVFRLWHLPPAYIGVLKSAWSVTLSPVHANVKMRGKYQKKRKLQNNV
jgi:hypothetical protein